MLNKQNKVNQEEIMIRHFSLEYWVDDDWYVGKLKEVPGVFSQGANLKELKENIKDAYRMIIDDESTLPDKKINTVEIGVEI